MKTVHVKTNVQEVTVDELVKYPWKGLSVELSGSGEIKTLLVTKGTVVLEKERGGLIRLTWLEKTRLPRHRQEVRFELSSRSRIDLAPTLAFGDFDSRTGWQPAFTFRPGEKGTGSVEAPGN